MSRRPLGDDFCGSFSESASSDCFFGNWLRFLGGNVCACGYNAFCDDKQPSLLLTAEAPADFAFDSKPIGTAVATQCCTQT